MEGALKDLLKLWDEGWFIPLPFAKFFELLNVLLPIILPPLFVTTTCFPWIPLGTEA
jgi:hypothetical protein